MSPLPHIAKTVDLLKWVKTNPNKPFDPPMVVSLSTNHSSDWEWQAVINQMEELGRQNYIRKLKQDPQGSTYWTITPRGESYLTALERAEPAPDPLIVSSRSVVPIEVLEAEHQGERPEQVVDKTKSGSSEDRPRKAFVKKIDVAMRALSDRPSDIDLLGFSDYVQALTDFIKSEKTQKPLTIGIDGPWGSGKTTLMRMMQSRLSGHDSGALGQVQTRTVWFDAWKYDREESLWASLALEILAQVRRQCHWYQRLDLWVRLNWKRFDLVKFLAEIGKLVLYPAALIVVSMLAAVMFKEYLYPELDTGKWAGISVGTSMIAALIGALKRVHDQVIKPFELNISKYIRTPDYRQRIGFLREFEEDFKFVVDAVTGNRNSILVIFIDDLDRCKPAKPVEVIEAINQLLDAEPCVFVMGMDVRTIADSIEAKYKDLAEGSVGGLSLGYRFLEKIVQVPFRLPKVSKISLGKLVDGNLVPAAVPTDGPITSVAEAEQLIHTEEIQGRSLEEAAQNVRSQRPDIPDDAVLEAKRNVFARTFDDDPEVRSAINDALPYLEANARKVKRFINLFRLQLLIANRRHLLEDNAIEIRNLSRWLVLVSSWPEVVDSLRDPEFPVRLIEANGLWRNLVREGGLENSQATQVLLKPYTDEPRISKYMGEPELIALLRSLVPKFTSGRDFAVALTPYLELSA